MSWVGCVSTLPSWIALIRSLMIFSIELGSWIHFNLMDYFLLKDHRTPIWWTLVKTYA